MSRILAIAFASSLMVITACTKKSENAVSADGSAAASATKEVNLATWNNYLSSEVQERFTKETGIVLKVSNYTSNEELLAKVQSGASGYDVAIPSDYMVEIMIKLNLLEPLDLSKIPNKAGLSASVLKQEYDSENRFSIPYAWLTAGIAVNRELFKGEIKGWKDLFENKELSGKVSMLDDVREVFAAALKLNGSSVNSTDPELLKKAQASLKQLRPRIKMFRTDSIDPLINKEIAVAHAYSSDALQASAKSGGKIEYIIPVEGGTRSIDNLVVLKGAKNAEAAHALINFLISKESNVSFVSRVFGGPVVEATKASLSPELQKNKSLFPDAGVSAKLERIKDVGAATSLYDRLWTEVKSE
jgi:spermidine/putrescine transport system substrate-binding protein